MRVDLLRAGMRATSTLTRMGAAAQEQLRGASAVDSRTDEPRRRALHGQHSRANARRETEHMSGDSPSGGARCGVYVFGAAAPLGELGLPLTPSEGWTLPEGAQVQCQRGVLAIRGKRHSKRGRL